MRSLLVISLLLIGLTPAAFGMTYEQYLKSQDNNDVDGMLGSLSKFNETTSIAPGLTFVLKNDLGKPQPIQTDFIGNVTLKADEKITHVFEKEGKYHYSLPNSKNKFTIEVVYPDWYYKVDNQTKQAITDDLIEKKRLESEPQILQEQIEQNEKRMNEIAKQAASIGKWTDELLNEAELLGEQNRVNHDKIMNNTSVIRNIEKKLDVMMNPDPVAPVEQPTKLEQIRSSENTPDWVKTLFTWHDQKLISTKELVIMVKYLIENEIIT